MKNFYVLLLLAVLLPIGMFAAPLQGNDASFYTKKSGVQAIRNQGASVSVSAPSWIKQSDEPMTQMSYKFVDDSVEYFNSRVSGTCTPFVCEPKTGTLFYVASKRYRKVQNGPVVGEINIIYSTDNGASWIDKIVFSAEDVLPFSSSLSVLNPNNETDPNKFIYTVTYSPYILNTADQLYYTTGRNYLFFKDGLDVNSYSDSYPEKVGPKNNNPLGKEWFNSQKSLSVSTEAGDFVYVYGGTYGRNTSGGQTTLEFSGYGVCAINLTTMTPYSQIPTSWNVNNFRAPANVDSSISSMKMSADKDGNVYAAVNANFAQSVDQSDPDIESKRVVGVSKSTDNGKTWSDFNRFPLEKLIDWMGNQGFTQNYMLFDLTSKQYPDQNWDFIATGVDEYIAVIRVLATKDQGEPYTFQGYWVELSYKNGDWDVNPATSLNLNERSNVYINGSRYLDWHIKGLTFIYRNDDKNYVFEDFFESQRGNEVSLSMTADGKNLVLKTIEDNGKAAVLETPRYLLDVHQTPDNLTDTVLTTDIYITTKNLESGTWSQKYNATQDEWFNRGTYVPDVVPSLNNIPILEFVQSKISDPANERYAYPLFLQNYLMHSDTAAKRVVPSSKAIVGTFDISHPEPINNPTYQDIEGVKVGVFEQLPFTLSDITPNPAKESAVINFTMDFSSDVTLNIHNSMGQIVKTINVPNANEGLNTITVVTGDLSAGAYYYTINVNGKTQTKLLNVIR